MNQIKALPILFALSSAALVSAHGHVKSWDVNGVSHAGYDPTYPPQYGKTGQRPVDTPDNGPSDRSSSIVTCGSNSPGSGLETWDLDAGSTVTAHYNTWPEGHKGTTAEYMARCPGSSCDGVAADSLDWFKIQEANYANGKWPTETVAATSAWSFQIPSDLAPGPYLVRHELLAMHIPNKPEFYPVCFQANLKSSGSVIPRDTVRFPQAYDANKDFMEINLYYQAKPDEFHVPGPAVYVAGAAVVAPVPAVASILPVPVLVAEPSSAAAPVSAAEPSSTAAPVPAAAASSSSVAAAPAEAPSSSAAAAPAVASSSSAAAAPAASSASSAAAAAPAVSSAAAVKPPKTCNKRKKRRSAKRAVVA